METLTYYVLTVTRWILPLLAVWLLVRCIRSMLSERYAPEIWAYLETPEGETAAIRHWECIIGRAKSCDVTINRALVSRTHASLIRSDNGRWRLYDLESKGGSFVGSQRDLGNGLDVHDGDILRFADTEMTFHDLDEEQLASIEAERNAPGAFVSPGLSFLILTVFQTVLALQFTAVLEGDELIRTVVGFGTLILIQWCYYLIMRALDRTGFEAETLAFFLSTLGVAVVATSSPGDMYKQVFLLVAAVLFYIILGGWLRSLRRVKATRWLAAAGALAFLALNLVAGDTRHGASNWLSFGGFSLQPSEFVKVAYIYVGAATLDRLFRKRNILVFIVFSAVCVGALALMGDFGTALIFFATFLVISFMRSGSFATVFLAITGAALACLLIFTVKPYIAQRFATWGHVWEDPYGAGWQQTQGLSAAASGGLFGVGAGRGWLKNVFAADTDMVFCVLCEELGLIIALCAMLALVVIAFFAVRNASQGRSSYFVIAACAAASLMLVQMGLNVFGSVDILPFTGVTFPFVSKGGSSLISCWGLLAFIKASDTRSGASFSVKLAARRRYEDGDGYDYEEESGSSEEVDGA
ncbi:MAG: FtsW/RodA/SpoVE family cell cycle protein [Oscillospiraceae bacterium]